MKLNGNKGKALIGTIIVHALIILALLFMALRTPLPLPEEQGVEVNIGTENPGNGNQVNAAVPSQPKPEEVQKKKETVTPPPVKKVQPQKDLTQDVEKAPALPEKKPVKKKPTPVKKEVVPKPEKKTPVAKETNTKPTVKENKVEKPEPVINQKALFKLSKNQTNQGKGIEEGDNEMGSPHGIDQSNNFMGQGGKGNGISYSLGGRGAKFIDKPTASFNEQGIVVVQIWVNPEGKVIRAQISAKGTTVVNENIRNIALRSALNSTFVSDPSAPAQQIGTITYTFILKR
ncbi:MAG: hypothetical protein IH595_09955 [Bacteroidales bacterium]|nr:hypothetical protein [Bacteroidales bacterium]